MSTSRPIQMNRRWSLCHAALTLCILLGTVPSTAGAATDCFAEEECSALVAKAKKAHNEKRYDDALALYQNAYDKVPDARLLVLRGRSFFKQGRADRALELYRTALPQLQGDAERRDAEEFIRQAEDSLRAKNQAPGTLTGAAESQGTGARPVGMQGEQTLATPVYKKWWFWTAIGGGALAITAIGLGVGLSLRPASVPPDANTRDTHF